jgi:hypothetical protein
MSLVLDGDLIFDLLKCYTGFNFIRKFEFFQVILFFNFFVVKNLDLDSDLDTTKSLDRDTDPGPIKKIRKSGQTVEKGILFWCKVAKTNHGFRFKDRKQEL